jgi:cyclomaltodextrinase
MRLLLKITFLLLIGFTGSRVYAASIVVNGKDAAVWLPSQTITGKVSTTAITNLKVYCNKVAYTVKINSDKTFKVTVSLAQGDNSIYANGEDGSSAIKSATIDLTLGYKPVPVVKPYAVISGSKITLNATVIDNPSNTTLKYIWTTPKNNPAACTIASKNSPTSAITVPNTQGIYYINLLVISGTDSASYQTYITRNSQGLHAYNMDTDHAAWIDSAVVYEINPGVFVKDGTYDDITAKLAEIKTLGINTLWIEPIYKTNDYQGQGYAITNYFAMRTDLGTEKQFANLIAAAKKLHFRVIFDFVPNHTALYHPYAQDCIAYGENSHYYNFYQHKNDGKPYSSNYLKSNNGLYSYFYKNLVNLDYNNTEVQQWMIEAIEYWLKKYDIDGYRFDTMWGVNSRTPAFGKKLSTALKAIKPNLLLLAEEKSCDKIVYQNDFDAAYDWSGDTTWVSQWAWAVDYSATKSLTIFNSSNVSKRSELLQAAIFKNSSISNKSLRFIENNDVPRFIASHNLSQTKMAAALVFSLPGLPMLYNGQEIGAKELPYATTAIFSKGKTIEQLDTSHLFPYYKKIIQLHAQYPALISASINAVTLTGSPYMMAFHRWEGNQHFIVIVNLDHAAATATIKYDKSMSYLQDTSYMHDELSGNTYKIVTDKASEMKISMDGYGIRWLLVDAKKKTDIPVPVSADDHIVVHTAVSPNYDGINDFLRIDGIEAYPNNSIIVVNSNGTKIFQASGYNNASRAFDGHNNVTGAMSPPGTYFYVLQYEANGLLKRKTGYFVLKY